MLDGDIFWKTHCGNYKYPSKACVDLCRFTEVMRWMQSSGVIHDGDLSSSEICPAVCGFKTGPFVHGV